MFKARSTWLFALLALQMTAGQARGQTMATNRVPVSPDSAIDSPARSPVVVVVAIDEVGITPDELKKSGSAVMGLFDALPSGSLMAVASFSGEPRIVLSPSADRGSVETALKSLKPGISGVALPDGLFDVVDYLGGVDASARGVLLVSAGNVREGDLHFEDPLNAAMTSDIPIVVLGVGQGDGKVLRRIARITRGEYVRLEVADPSMLARALSSRSAAPPPHARLQEPPVTPAPTGRSSFGLLGAAAILLVFGGILILGVMAIFALRGRRPAPPPTQLSAPDLLPPGLTGVRLPEVEEDPSLERTLVVNTDPTLRAISGPSAGASFRLSASGETSIGRSRRNDVVVSEDAASARHCRIDREGDSYVVHDLGATNGIWVNGTKTSRAVLLHGDRLKVGDTVFAVSLFGDRT